MKRFWVFFLLVGCAVGPDYVPPENEVPDGWVETTSNEEVLTEWWKAFNDPLLTQYIEKAAQYNYSVRAAEANILQAVALRQVAASNLYPMIGADFNGTKTYFSKNGPVFAIGPAIGSLPGAVSQSSGLPFAVQIPQIQNLFNFLFDATWELDLFGKTRRSIEAASAQIGSAREQKNDMLLTVMGEVARNYVQLRSNQKLALLTEKKIDLLEKTAAILSESWKQGLINRLDYESVEAQVSSAKAELPPLIAEVYKNIYAISILTGELPETLLPELLPVQPMPKIPAEIAMGLRSDLLRRRPDIRTAERQLAAATANIGVAVASFFPTVSLFGDIGLQSLQLSKLFTGKSKTWDYGGDVTTPIFQGGQLFGQLHANQAQASYAFENYQQVVLSALQEAEKSLATYKQDLKVVDDLSDVVKKNRILVTLSKARYEQGLINLIHFIDMERQYLSVKQNLVNSELKTLTDLIALYKALGGGWEISFQKNP